MKKPAIFFGALFLLIIAWAIYYAFSTGPHFPQVPKSKIPPPVIVTLSRSNAPLQVFLGTGGSTFVLPDGSLWRWGENSQLFTTPRALIPEQVGTDCDWLQVVSGYTHAVGIRTDNTLWEWGRRGSLGNVTSPLNINSQHEWVAVGMDNSGCVALKRDGSLWAWGYLPPSLPRTGTGNYQTNLVQVGTNKDWTALAVGQNSSVHLFKKDGTLWLWGSAYDNKGHNPIFRSIPIQFSNDTNWVPTTKRSISFLRNTKGEVYSPLFADPKADSPVSEFRQPLATDVFTDEVGYGFDGKPSLYTIHPDGTLWQKSLQLGTNGFTAIKPWRRFGDRSDWVSIWNWGATTLALTRDGTLWLWGQDQGQEPVLDTKSKINELKNDILKRLHFPPARTSTMAMSPHQKEPRPLLRLVYSNTNQPAAQK